MDLHKLRQLPQNIHRLSDHTRVIPTAFELVFYFLLTLYWALQFLRGDSVEILAPDATYILFVGPAAVFGTLGIFYLVFTSEIFHRSSIVLLLGLVPIIVVALARADARTLGSVGLLMLSLAIIFQIAPRISINFVNILFLLSIPLTTFLFLIDYSIYTFLPGLGNHPDLWWRISPMPSSAEGGLFATAVYLMNINLRGQRYRLPMIVMSVYFLVLSGNRTGLFAALIGTVYFLIRQRGRLSRSGSRRWFALIAAFLFVMAIFGSNLLLYLPFANSDIVRTLVFRQEAVGNFDVGDQVGTAAIRQWIFEQHWAAFRENPLFGIGTFDLQMLNSGYGALDNSVGGTEAFITALLARIGLLILPLLAALFLIRQPVQGDAADLSLSAKLALLIGMTTYGSFVNVYDIVFLLLVLSIAGTIYVPVRPAAAPSLTGRRTDGSEAGA